MESDKPSHQSHIALIMILLSSFMAGSGQLLWKLAINRANGYIDIFSQPWLYLGIFLYILATGFMVTAFKSGDFSVLFPILATSFIWVTLLASYFFESENMTITRGFGIALIFFGCSLLGWQQKRNVHYHKNQKSV